MAVAGLAGFPVRFTALMFFDRSGTRVYVGSACVPVKLTFA